MEIDTLNESAEAIHLSDNTSEQKLLDLHPLIRMIKEQFEEAKDGRREWEDIAIRAVYNFRGKLGEEVPYTSTEKSKAFIKTTKTKCMAAFGQIVDVLFGAGEMPLKVEPTPDPIGIARDAHIDLKDATEEESGPGEPTSIFGFEGDGRPLEPGESFIDRIGKGLKNTFKGSKIKEGKGEPSQHIQLSPAEISAQKMTKKIHDQLIECDAEASIHHCLLEMVILGTGCIKGPMVVDKEYPRWNEKGEYAPVNVNVPKISSPSVWSIYPDPDALNNLDKTYAVERHRMTKSKLRGLKSRPFFRKSAIDKVIEMGPNWIPEHWEFQIEQNNETNTPTRWEVLEYWGTADVEWLEELGVELPELSDGKEHPEEYPINAWICHDELIRVVLNPFTPTRDIYMMVPYETNPYSPWGVGCSENMEQLQTLMNGFLRIAIDNAALSSNIILEVDEDNLVPGQTLEISPGKIFRRAGGAPGQAIFATKFPNTTGETMNFFKEFRQMADEVTGIPSFSHGQTGITGTNRTAAGVSMLMGAASVNIKTVIKNIDNFLLKPLGTALYAWNMQFNFDQDIVGDLAVKATGMSSLLRKEVQSQRIIQFIQAGQTPMTAPFVNFEYLLREGAKTMDLDPDKAVLDPKRAQLQAQTLAPIFGAQGNGQGPVPGTGLPQGDQGTAIQDPNQTGGGNITGGAPPTPGEQGFSANNGTQQQTLQ